MIADIEFRWVKREVNKDMLTSKPADYERVLQFRKLFHVNEPPFDGEAVGSPFGTYYAEWSGWQDVPVVEE